MGVAFGDSFTIRNYLWAAWKAALLSHNGIGQYEDDGTITTIWFYDGPEVHVCAMWDGNVPDVVAPSYSQAQNDIDKADFTTNYRSSFNLQLLAKTLDGRPVVSPNMFPGGTTLYFTGSGDDISSGRGAGSQFNLASSSGGTTTLTFSFNDWVQVAGGSITWSGAQLGDWMSLSISATGTTITANGGGTGNCNRTAVGGGNYIITPAPGTGAYDVDLTAATPIQADFNTTNTPTGYWNWNMPGTGKGTITAAPTAGQGRYNLFTANLALSRFVNKFQLLGSGSTVFTVPTIMPRLILPHWTFTATLNNSSGLLGHTLAACWHLTVARNQTG